jgi:succinate-semialdehyde dehydrogenase / glutarate-semialdehyde dehydrogenase
MPIKVRSLEAGHRHALGGTYFEPVAQLFSFGSEEEVVAGANDTKFGLASYVYTNDNALVWRVSEALEYGMVGVNTELISTAEAPFGGIKMSGHGREGSHYGMNDYMEINNLCLGGIGK